MLVEFARADRLRGAVAVLILLPLTAWAFAPEEPTLSVAPGVRVDPAGVYNPVLAGETLPDGFRQILPRDAIAPVYEPEFVPAGAVGWLDETDVIGVAVGDEAKAYPVGFLGGREMVIDEIDGIPILVTW